MPVFYRFIYHLEGENIFQNLPFSKLAIISTTLITQIIDTNALVSHGNRMKLA